MRVCVGGAMAGAFVLVAMLAEPGRSSANQGVALPDAGAALPPSSQQITDLRGLLGEMTGRGFRIEVVSGKGEPTYRVLTGDGRVVAEGLRIDEVYTVDENLTVDRFGDYPGVLNEPLMLLDASRID